MRIEQENGAFFSHCPRCGVASVLGAVDCLRCGLIFAKYKQREDGAKEDASLPRQGIVGASAAPTDVPTERQRGENGVALGRPTASSSAKQDGQRGENGGLWAQIVMKVEMILQGVGLRPWVGPKTAAYFTVQERALEIAIQTMVPMVALLLAMVGFVVPLLGPARVFFHEMGHAVIGWLTSRRATPFILWTNVSLHPSVVAGICVAFLLGVMIWAGVRERRYFMPVVAGTLLCLQGIFTFVLSTRTYEKLFFFGGIGGEFYLSALVIVAFHYELPQRLYWSVLRFFALPVAMYAFLAATFQWRGILYNPRLAPFGTAMHGQEDAGGDLNRLYADFGWSVPYMAKVFLTIALICGGVMLLNYVVSVLRLIWTFEMPDVTEESVSSSKESPYLPKMWGAG